MAENLSPQLGHLALQYEPMDAIHREFVTLCAALGAADGAACLEPLDALIAHTVLHFEQENDWMQTHGFPAAGCHRREHDTVLDVIREVRTHALRGDTEVVARLAEELPNWFSHHVAVMDAGLAEFLREVEAGAAAAVQPL